MCADLSVSSMCPLIDDDISIHPFAISDMFSQIPVKESLTFELLLILIDLS